MRGILAEWVVKAEQDFAVAEREWRVRKHPVYDAVCFHAQQCAEKYLKARLVKARILFTKTHDLSLLLTKVVSVEPSWEMMRADLAFLSDFAIEFRYPGESADRVTAQQAIRRCREFRLAARLTLGLSSK